MDKKPRGRDVFTKTKPQKQTALKSGVDISIYDFEGSIFGCVSLSCPWLKYLEIGTVIVDKN